MRESRGSSCRSTETACSRSSSYRTEPRRRPSSSRTGCSCPCCSYSVKPASTMGAGWGETLTNWPRTRGRCSARRFLDWYRTTCIRPYRMVMRSKKETRERERESQCRSTHTHTHRERERERESASSCEERPHGNEQNSIGAHIPCQSSSPSS